MAPNAARWPAKRPQRADLVLFVTDSDLNQVEYSALVELAASHKPILLVLNNRPLLAG